MSRVIKLLENVGKAERNKILTSALDVDYDLWTKERRASVESGQWTPLQPVDQEVVNACGTNCFENQILQ